jgi:hypothetical protein
LVVKITQQILPRRSEYSGAPVRHALRVEIVERLESLRSRVEEARAAADIIAEGDPTAMAALSSEVDAMAEDVAALKALTAGPPS